MTALDGATAIVPSVVDLMERLVAIESPSRDEPGVHAVMSLLSEEAERRGARVSRIPAPGYGEHLVVEMGAVGRPLLVVGHLDTVHPRGTLARFPFQVREGRVYGPGIQDMKGSWAAAIGALDLLRRQGGSPRSLRWVVTCDEEIGAAHSRLLLEAEGRGAQGALVLEPSIPGGALKVRRKGVAWYTVHVKGRPAHAGVEPERGANAIHELARVVGGLAGAANEALGTTVNAGLIRGGSAVNVVPEHAWVELDVRFWSGEEGRRVDAWVRDIRSKDRRCVIDVNGGIDRWALEPDPGSADLTAAVLDAAAGLGRTLGTGETGGASDAQLLSAVGCPVADGLGIEGAGAHTLEEHILAKDIPFRIALYAALFASS
jgi:glutamate carboxypeptidase